MKNNKPHNITIPDTKCAKCIEMRKKAKSNENWTVKCFECIKKELLKQ